MDRRGSEVRRFFKGSGFGRYSAVGRTRCGSSYKLLNDVLLLLCFIPVAAGVALFTHVVCPGLQATRWPMTKMLAKDLPQGTPSSPPAARTRRSNPLGTGGTGGVLDVEAYPEE